MQTVLSGLQADNLILVDANSVGSLEEAQRWARNSDKKFILIGLGAENELQKNENFSGLLALANVAFVPAFALKKIPEKYQELVSGIKKRDDTLFAVSELNNLSRSIAALKHDLHHAASDSATFQNWLRRAGQLGFTGSPEEIKDKVLKWTPDTAGALAGQFLPGIFVDALDTLFTAEWRLDTVVMLAVTQIANQTDKKIFVISDSDRNLVQEKLRINNIDWMLLSKYELRGATLEFVVDNLSRQDFQDTYNIKTKEFMSVDELCANFNHPALG